MMQLQDCLKVCLCKELGLYATGNPKDFYLGKKRRGKKKGTADLTAAWVEAGEVGQDSQLAKGEGVAEALAEKCWRHLAQKALALGVVGRLSACLTQPSGWLTVWQALHWWQLLLSIALGVLNWQETWKAVCEAFFVAKMLVPVTWKGKG